jgi:hypothetical protein
LRSKHFHHHTSSTSIERRYPASGALFQIGKPALPALVKYIAGSANDEPLSRDKAAEAALSNNGGDLEL